MNMKELLFCCKHFKKSLQFINFSFSQEGEDVVIDRLLDYKKDGFYVDLGAHHPICYSNTLKFYVKGWHGLNIDAMPGSMKLFQKIRPRDINIEAGISDYDADILYFDFQEKALNTFDSELAKSHIDKGHKLERQIHVKTKPINSLLDMYVPAGQSIDFMDIDIEGFDTKIVSAIDWKKYRPSLVLVEAPSQAQNAVDKLNCFSALTESGYKLIATTGRTCIYCCSSQ